MRMELDFELVLEGISLGLDALILGFLFKSYESCSAYIEALKEAEQVEISQLGQLGVPKTRRRSWFKFWQSRKPDVVNPVLTDHTYRYVCLTGRVEPIDKSRILKSADGQSTGVIHKVITKEVVTVRNGSRFWIDEERIVKNIQHEIPWILKSTDMSAASSSSKGVNNSVQVIDGLNADRIDMSTIRNEFTPAAFSLSGWLGGWVAGMQLKGTQEIEEMVTDGSLMTAVGELIINSDGSMQLRAPTRSDRALPFILSTLPYSALLNTYETLVSVCKWSLVFFGGAGVIIAYMMVRKWLKLRYSRRHVREEDDILRDLRESRRQPTDEDEERDLPDWQRCVVCLVRNREVIVLPCGHVCLCADCMVLINQQNVRQRNCPMCRHRIEQIARAYVP